MIGYLRGKVLEVSGNQVLLDVNGVGYLVGVPSSLASRLQKQSEEAAPGVEHADTELRTYTQVGENVLALFGFESREQMEFFQMLLTVDGVGPKIALAILGAGELDEIKGAVAGGNPDFFKKVKGAGPKTLQKVIVELSGKLKEEGVKPIRSGPEAAVEQGLLGLGFKPDQVKRGLEAVDWASKPTTQVAMQVALAALRSR